MTVTDSADRRVWNVQAPTELAERHCKDSDIGPIVRLRLQYDEQLSFDLIRDESSNTKVYWSRWPRLVVCEGVAYRIVFYRHGKPDGIQLLVPTNMRAALSSYAVD